MAPPDASGRRLIHSRRWSALPFVLARALGSSKSTSGPLIIDARPLSHELPADIPCSHLLPSVPAGYTRWPEWRLRAGNLLPAIAAWLRNLPVWLSDPDTRLDLAWLRQRTRHVLERAGRRMRRWGARLAGRPVDAALWLDLANQMPEQRTALEQQVNAFLAYRPQHRRLPVAVLRCRVQPLLSLCGDPGLGWDVVAGSGSDCHTKDPRRGLFGIPMQISHVLGAYEKSAALQAHGAVSTSCGWYHTVPGTHFSILIGRDVDGLAATLNAVLARHD